MKTFNEVFRKYRFGVLMFCVIYGSIADSYGQQLKPQKSNISYSQIIMLKPGMSKEEVKKILGEPYKISFSTNDKQEVVENMFYKPLAFIDKRYTITYKCVFVNSTLSSLQEKENLYDNEKTVFTKALQ